MRSKVIAENKLIRQLKLLRNRRQDKYQVERSQGQVERSQGQVERSRNLIGDDSYSQLVALFTRHFCGIVIL